MTTYNEARDSILDDDDGQSWSIITPYLEWIVSVLLDLDHVLDLLRLYNDREEQK